MGQLKPQENNSRFCATFEKMTTDIDPNKEENTVDRSTHLAYFKHIIAAGNLNYGYHARYYVCFRTLDWVRT